MRKRHQYRILGTATLFALVGVAFFGAYHGSRPNIDSGHESKHHPDFLSREYFIEDPVAFFTLGLAVVTGLLFWATVRVARESREASAKALEASTRATETLIATERPYVTGGGGLVRETDA